MNIDSILGGSEVDKLPVENTQKLPLVVNNIYNDIKINIIYILIYKFILYIGSKAPLISHTNGGRITQFCTKLFSAFTIYLGICASQWIMKYYKLNTFISL